MNAGDEGDHNTVREAELRGSSAHAPRGVWVVAGLIAGGLLVMVGATLPWLTLYAGLHHYGGMIGLYGWITFGAGSLALALGLLALRIRLRWLRPASAVFGCGLLLFAAWLFVGLEEILHQPGAIMLVPRPGPGLIVVISGATLIVIAPAAEYVFRRRPIGARIEPANEPSGAT